MSGTNSFSTGIETKNRFDALTELMSVDEQQTPSSEPIKEITNTTSNLSKIDTTGVEFPSMGYYYSKNRRHYFNFRRQTPGRSFRSGKRSQWRTHTRKPLYFDPNIPLDSHNRLQVSSDVTMSDNRGSMAQTTQKKVLVIMFAFDKSSHKWKLLLLQDATYQAWTFLSGKVEQGEMPIVCAYREIREELKNLCHPISPLFLLHTFVSKWSFGYVGKHAHYRVYCTVVAYDEHLPEKFRETLPSCRAEAENNNLMWVESEEWLTRCCQDEFRRGIWSFISDEVCTVPVVRQLLQHVLVKHSGISEYEEIMQCFTKDNIFHEPARVGFHCCAEITQ